MYRHVTARPAKHERSRAAKGRRSERFRVPWVFTLQSDIHCRERGGQNSGPRAPIRTGYKPKRTCINSFHCSSVTVMSTLPSSHQKPDMLRNLPTWVNLASRCHVGGQAWILFRAHRRFTRWATTPRTKNSLLMPQRSEWDGEMAQTLVFLL